MSNTEAINLKNEQEIGLELAYKQFFLETERLELAYRTLQEHFQLIESTLQDMHTKLYGKLAELDFTTCYLDAILSHIAQGILFIDLNGIVTTYNLAAESIFGIPASQTLFRPFADHFEDTLFGFSLKGALHKQSYPKTNFASWTRSDGKKIDLEVEITFVGMHLPFHPIDYRQPPSNVVQGVLILARNITEMRRLQLVANRYDRLQELGEMAARLAHEIRNPLGGIKGFASLLQQDLKNQPALQQMATQIIEGADSLGQFVTHILNYARPFQPQLEAVDLISFLNEMLQMVQADSSFSPQIIFQVESTFTHLIVSIDPQLFKSALLNLLVNALQAMPNGGALTIGINQDREDAIVQIKDNGVGIAEENLGKIFSPFFTTKDSGNGLGLSEVHKVIQAHGGSIEVQSKIGQGTTFTIKIPLKVSQ